VSRRKAISSNREREEKRGKDGSTTRCGDTGEKKEEKPLRSTHRGVWETRERRGGIGDRCNRPRDVYEEKEKKRKKKRDRGYSTFPQRGGGETKNTIPVSTRNLAKKEKSQSIQSSRATYLLLFAEEREKGKRRGLGPINCFSGKGGERRGEKVCARYAAADRGKKAKPVGRAPRGPRKKEEKGGGPGEQHSIFSLRRGKGKSRVSTPRFSVVGRERKGKEDKARRRHFTPLAEERGSEKARCQRLYPKKGEKKSHG